MAKWKLNRHILLLLFAIFVLLVGCSSSETEGDTSSDTTASGDTEETTDSGNAAEEENLPEEENFEEVTLLMMTHWNDEQFENNFKSHLEKVYPHITLEHVQSRHDEIEENVFAKGLYPDIIMTTVNDYYLEMDLLLDLTQLIETFNFDLDRIDPAILGYLQNVSNDGELNGMPLIRPEYALVYNPDIFDTFGVPYPTDNMTWDEVIELGRQVTGERNGVHYRGLHPGQHDFMMRQIENAQLVDPVTHEPIIDQNEAFKIYLERLQAVYSIPGNGFDSLDDLKNTRGVDLLREGQLAMAADRAFAGAYISKSLETGLNFDFVTYPRWGGEWGDYGPNEPGNGLVVTTTSEHPEEAFRAVAYFLSDEYQAWQAAQGNLPAVVTQEVKDAFLQDHPDYEVVADKNLAAITNATPAPLPIKSQFEAEILEGTDYREGIFNGEDINTIIRKMQDQAEGNAKNIINRQ